MLSGLAVFALLLASLSCQSRSAPAIPTDLAERAAQELDILESVFRYQFTHNASSATATGELTYFFLSLAVDKDPPPELMKRFAGHTPIVEPISSADPNKGLGVRHEQNGKSGIILRLGSPRWIDGDTVEVDGGYYEANRSSSGNTYRVERRDGKWVGVSSKMRWIS